MRRESRIIEQSGESRALEEAIETLLTTQRLVRVGKWVLLLLGGISVVLGLKTLSEDGAWSTFSSGLFLIALGPVLDRAVQRAIRRTRDELARLNNSHEPGEPSA